MTSHCLRRSSPVSSPSLAEAGAGQSGREMFYSVDTVRHFKQQATTAAGAHFYFLLGADSFLDIPTWKDYETLLGLCDFIVASRPGFRCGRAAPGDSAGAFRAPGSGAHAARPAGHRVCGALWFTCSTPSPATFRRPKYAVAWIETNRFTGLCRRASRNTLTSRPFTGDRKKSTRFRPHVRAAIERRAGQTGGGHCPARPRRPGRVHRLFSALHGLQLAATCRDLRRSRGKARAPRACAALHREGKAGSDWMLLDFGGLIVHVFTERARHYYDLERLWRAARRIEFRESRTGNPLSGAAEAEG